MATFVGVDRTPGRAPGEQLCAGGDARDQLAGAVSGAATGAASVEEPVGSDTGYVARKGECRKNLPKYLCIYNLATNCKCPTYIQ